MTAHVVVLHRWRAPYALYENYLDHARHRVSYVTTEIGTFGVPSTAAATTVVSATDSLTETRHAVADLADRFGTPAAIVALKEDDLLTAAQLTADYDLDGRRPADLAVFRDKLAMANAVRAAGLAQPEFTEVATAADIAEFGRRHGWPVVVKPRLGSSSEGVEVFAAADVDPSWQACPDGAIAQSFIEGTLLHVDGVFDGRRLGPWRASRYLGSPLQFRRGAWVGSVEVDDPAIHAAVGSYADALLAALTHAPTVFHLEVFLRRDAQGQLNCVLVEVAARAGGAEIPFLWREVHGFDLVGEAFRYALGDNDADASVDVRPTFGEYAGLLLVPTPTRRPCLVTSVRHVLGTPAAPPELYAEQTTTVGEIVPDAPAYYEHVGGRFRFRGRSTAAVEQAIRGVARGFSVTGDHIPHGIGPVTAIKESV